MSILMSEPCRIAEQQIQTIAAPFFTMSGLSFFSYARDLNHSRSFSLQTDNELYYAWHEAKSPYCSNVIANGVYDSKKIQNDNLQALSKQLNYNSSIHIFKKHNSFSEIITFAASDPSINVLEFYINNLQLINKFILHFKDEAGSIINEAMNAPVSIPACMDYANFTKQDSLAKADSNNDFAIQQYHFDDKLSLKLSAREKQCLSLYIRGKPTSQIADIMNIKKVTADTHMKNIKTKFKCDSKSDLFEKLWDLGILSGTTLFD